MTISGTAIPIGRLPAASYSAPAGAPGASSLLPFAVSPPTNALVAKPEHVSKDRTDAGADFYKTVSRIGFAGTILAYSRMVAAIPTAHHAGTLPKLLFSMAPVVGPGPNIDVVPYKTGLWKTAYRASNILGTGMMILSPMIAGPNLIAGWQQGGGPEGLVNTKAGRTGLFASIGPLMAASVMGIAAFGARDQGLAGALRATIDSPLRGNFRLGMIGALLGPLVIANESGVFDFADKNSDVNVTDSIFTGIKNMPHTLLHTYLGL